MATFENSAIIHGNKCAEYFKDMVVSSIKNQHAEVSGTVEFYLVNLLNECINAEKIFHEVDAEKEDSLTRKLSRALNADTFERIRRFKELGDFTLFIAGFFSASLNRKLVDVDFYGVIGSIAYANLAVIMRTKTNGEVFSSLYGELAEKFSPITDVLSEVSQKTSLRKEENILRIYEKWVRTGGKRDADRLIKEGIVPTENVRSKYLQ